MLPSLDMLPSLRIVPLFIIELLPDELPPFMEPELSLPDRVRLEFMEPELSLPDMGRLEFIVPVLLVVPLVLPVRDALFGVNVGSAVAPVRVPVVPVVPMFDELLPAEPVEFIMPGLLA